MSWIKDDGGRADAGLPDSKRRRDCAVRSVAIATGKPYTEVAAELRVWCERERPGTWTRRRSTTRSDPETGVYMDTLRRYMDSIGWEWVPTMRIGSGCTTHLTASELPAGRLVVRVSKHFTAMINGIVHDTHDPSRNGTRCVYGYWKEREWRGAPFLEGPK